MPKDFRATALERAVGRQLAGWRNERELSLAEAGERVGFSSAKLSMSVLRHWRTCHCSNRTAACSLTSSNGRSVSRRATCISRSAAVCAERTRSTARRCVIVMTQVDGLPSEES